MKDNEKRTNDMQQETTAPSEAGPILCRFMRETDVPACAAIEACADDGWSEAALREELAQENARLFVAEAEGKVAGLAVFQLVCGEASLYAVSTAPAFRRQGVARALLSWAFAALCLQGAQDVFLEVRAQNSAAQALYRSLGFVQTGLRRNFYATPADDAVLMQKTL